MKAYSINELNHLEDLYDQALKDYEATQAENDCLRKELASRNKMLMQAHFQNKKLSDELLIAQNQYQKVVEQNRELEKAYNDLEEMYGLGG